MKNLSELLSREEKLREEADVLLENRGLRKLLSEYGTVHLVGSYTLKLMAWRDLDIFLESSKISLDHSFELGRRIGNLLLPFKMFLTDYTTGLSEDNYHGLYWGIRLGELRNNAWKIDLHMEDWKKCLEMVEKCDRKANRLTNENRCQILSIKSEIWNHPEYRKTITSQDVYDAVLDHGVTTMEGFWSYIEKRG
jgi:hypothetical protein